MKNQYSIHQVAELLGITTDAIRLYEKEGLVEPIRKEENGYRYYEVEQIHRILGIVLYRKLDVGLAEIKKLSGVSDFHGMCDAFDSLIQSNLSKIDYLQRKVEKMRFMKQHLEEIGQGVDTYRICSLASRYVLYPGLSTTADYKQIEEVLNSPVFQFGNFCYNIETESGREESLCFVVREPMAAICPVSVEWEKQEHQEECLCAYTVVGAPELHQTQWNLQKICDYALGQGYHCGKRAYAFYVYSLTKCDSVVDYYEIYLPIYK